MPRDRVTKKRSPAEGRKRYGLNLFGHIAMRRIWRGRSCESGFLFVGAHEISCTVGSSAMGCRKGSSTPAPSAFGEQWAVSGTARAWRESLHPGDVAALRFEEICKVAPRVL